MRSAAIKYQDRNQNEVLLATSDTLFSTPFLQKKRLVESSGFRSNHNVSPHNYSLTFTGKEWCKSQWLAQRGLERGISETGFSYFGARYYDGDLSGLFLSVDMMADKYPSISPYAYCAWNPVKLVDPDGRDISTHVDQDGTVVSVFNDGDNGVYQHQRNADRSIVTEYQLSKRAAKYGTSCGGTKIGETEYWDEFVSPENGETMRYYKLQIGKSFDPIINNLHSQAMKMDLIEIANKSKGGELFDIKKDYPNVGALLNGKYATSRSAGNFLAGYNAKTGSYLGVGVSFTTFQQLAGALHIEESNGRSLSKWQMVDIVLWGHYNSNSNLSSFKPPTWGEVQYQYRMSQYGWNHVPTN